MKARRRTKMDQIKTGKFIAERRRNIGLTQMQLAEKLNITDRAVSKWETGRAMPDSSIMLELCDILGISVTDLLCGEVVTMENYNKETEKNLIEITRQKEAADRHLLHLEIVIGIICSVFMFTLIILASYASIESWLRVLLILIGFLPFIILVPFMIRIEQKAGYYKCGKCGHLHIPKYTSVLWAMHFGTTRYMKCPECEKRSWQVKVISKD